MSPLGIIVVIILVIVLLGGFTGIGGVPYGYGAGHYGIGGIGLVLIILAILMFTGRL